MHFLFYQDACLLRGALCLLNLSWISRRNVIRRVFVCVCVALLACVCVLRVHMHVRVHVRAMRARVCCHVLIVHMN